MSQLQLPYMPVLPEAQDPGETALARPKPEPLIFEVLRRQDLDLHLHDFLLDVQAAGCSPKTLRFYQQRLDQFTAWLKEHNVHSGQDVTPTHIRAFLTDKAQEHTPGGVHAYWRAIRAFVGFLVREGIQEKSTIERIRPPKVDQEILDPVSLDTVSALLATCDKSEIGLRDRAILLTLLDTGVRAGELVALNVGDVALSTGSITVRKSKSRRARIVFAGKKTRKAISTYLRARGDPGPTEPLFLTYPFNGAESGRFTYEGLKQVVRRLRHRVEASGSVGDQPLRLDARQEGLKPGCPGFSPFVLQEADLQDRPVLGSHCPGDGHRLPGWPHLRQVGPHPAHTPPKRLQPGHLHLSGPLPCRLHLPLDGCLAQKPTRCAQRLLHPSVAEPPQIAQHGASLQPIGMLGPASPLGREAGRAQAAQTLPALGLHAGVLRVPQGLLAMPLIGFEVLPSAVWTSPWRSDLFRLHLGNRHPQAPLPPPG